MRCTRQVFLPGLLAAAVLLFPPWAQDDPDAPMGAVVGTKYSRGHSFILARPAPEKPWDSRIYAPPPAIPVRVDRPQRVREVVTVIVLGWALAVVLARSALNPARPDARAFGLPTLTAAGLAALLLPLPVLGPVAFWPPWVLRASNHGVAGWAMGLAVLLVYGTGVSLCLGVAAAVVRSARARRKPDSPLAAA